MTYEWMLRRLFTKRWGVRRFHLLPLTGALLTCCLPSPVSLLLIQEVATNYDHDVKLFIALVNNFYKQGDLSLQQIKCLRQNNDFLPLPPKVKEVTFSPLSVCLSVCLSLFVCMRDISKSYLRIRMKFCGQVGYVTRTNWFDFGEDPNLDPFLRIYLFIILHHWVTGLKRHIAEYLKKLWTDLDEICWRG